MSKELLYPNGIKNKNKMNKAKLVSDTELSMLQARTNPALLNKDKKNIFNI